MCGSTCSIRLEAVCASEEGNSGSPKPLVERASVEVGGWLFPAGVEALEQRCWSGRQYSPGT